MKKVAALACVFLFIASVGITQEMRLKSKDVKLTNRVKNVDAAELSKIQKLTRADLRPIMKKMTFRKGETLIYTDQKSGYKYYIQYDGKSSAKYVAKNAKGENIPVTPIKGITGSGSKAEKTWKVCSTFLGETIYDDIPCDSLVYN